MKKNERIDYLNGMHISNVKKVCQFYFGEEFIEIKRDNKNWTFNVIVTANVDDKYIAEFEGFWGVRILRTESII